MHALIVVDIQNDFLPGGALAVNGADLLVPKINQLMPLYPLVVASQDWHPPHHVSFASTHHKQVGDFIAVRGAPQRLWPDHCIENSWGAHFPKGLETHLIHKVIHKGCNPTVDSYSTFFDNAHLHSTGLHEFLQEKGFKKIHIVGVATDYCVKYSALDGVNLGYEVTVITDCCKAVNANSDDEIKSYDLMLKSNIKLIDSNYLI